MGEERTFVDQMRRDNANYRRRLKRMREALEEHQEFKVKFLLRGVMDWDLFQELIGIEHVIEPDGRVNLGELAARVNAKQATLPAHVVRRVTEQELLMNSKLKEPGCGQVCDRASGRQTAPGEQRGRASGRTEDFYPGGL